MSQAIIILNPNKDQSLRRYHPWVFSGAIQKITGEVKDGDIVEVCDNKGNYLGTGHYQKGSITVRIFSFEKTLADVSFWKKRLLSAYNCRKQCNLSDNPDTNVYRLVFAEGDGLPGLIIDYYNGTCVLQAHTIGMHNARLVIAEALKVVYGEKLKAVFDKSAETLPSHYSGAKNEYLFGKKGTMEVLENGNRFMIDWEEGQKTGFFIDQRENRNLLGEYSKGKNVLNTFCYTGGFSVYAGKAGAREVHSVDSSKRAMELLEKNISLNAIKNHTSFTEDVFDFLKNKHNEYDVIVLDPPAFAKTHKVTHNALMGYRRLNEEAIKQIKPGGIIFTFSCSQAISRVHFSGAVMSAALQAGRNVRILHQLSQPQDHCMNVFHPEGEYLKGLVLYVE